MRFPIEYNGERVELKPIGALLVAGRKTETGFQSFPGGATLAVCAWCVPPSEQQPLRDAGFTLSHGICASCLDKQRRKEEV